MAVVCSNMRIQFIFVLCSIVFLLLNNSSAYDYDLDVIVRDFGTNGTSQTVSMELVSGMQPGSMISVVSRTHYRGTINICDSRYNNLIQIDNRIRKNYILLSSYLNGKYLRDSIKVKPNPTVKDELTVTSVVHEEKGYNVYVNGEKVAFYRHKFENPATYIQAFHNRVYKIVYVASKQDIHTLPLPPPQK